MAETVELTELITKANETVVQLRGDVQHAVKGQQDIINEAALLRDGLGIKGLDPDKIPSLIKMASTVADLEVTIQNIRNARGSEKAAEEYMSFDEQTRLEFKEAREVLDDTEEDTKRRLMKLRDLVTVDRKYKRALVRAIKHGGPQFRNVAQGDLDTLLFRELPKGFRVPEDLKASVTGTGLSTDFGPGAGFLAPVTSERVIDRLVIENSPIVQLVDTRTIGGTSYEGLIRNTNLDPVQYTGERQAGTTQTELNRWYKKRIEVWKSEVDTGLTDIQMEDSELDVVNELEQDAGISFARDFATKILNGTGVEQAEGLFVSSETLTMNSEEAATFTMDNLRSLPYELKADYRMGGQARFMMSRSAIVTTLLFREDVNGPHTGQYLWQPSTQEGSPSRLAGEPWVEMVDMDAVGANAFPVAYGNLKRAYRRIVRRGLKLLRDEVTTRPYVLFFWSQRWGGRVWIGEAFVKMKCAVT